MLFVCYAEWDQLSAERQDEYESEPNLPYECMDT
jgi:hypothetical protein